MEWLDFSFVMPPNLFIHWECWSGGTSNKKIRKGLRMIWHAAIWVLWKARNNCIFNNEVTRWVEVVDEIKVLSWRWLLGRFQVPTCQLYEFVLLVVEAWIEFCVFLHMLAATLPAAGELWSVQQLCFWAAVFPFGALRVCEVCTLVGAVGVGCYVAGLAGMGADARVCLWYVPYAYARVIIL
ncbi:hypothetical protein MTR_3g070320 [Medicago truncatula]|uniref:Uncharacterized protein n=1 Tax=Medicago truncatula TaxID=3880 RepID=G7JB72_MEDTR|nr:hypothetical protein MTR_3g070320 [Medicago truncatula]